jgi:hypothetical protein
MKGKKKGMKGGSKAYNEHSAEKRRQQDPAKVVTEAFNRAQQGA